MTAPRVDPETQRYERDANADYRRNHPEDAAGAARDAKAPVERLPVAIPLEIPLLDLAGAARDGIPPIEWSVEYLLEHLDLLLVAAAPKTGKTTMLLSLAVALARACAWCGLSVPRPLRVLYLDGEAGARMIMRQCLTHTGADIPPGLFLASVAGFTLDDVRAVDAIRRAIEKTRAEVVVFDSLNNFLGSSDRRDSGAIGACMRELQAFRDRDGCTVIASHHLRKQPPGAPSRRVTVDDLRDSSEIAAGVSSIMALTRAPQDGFVRLREVARRGGGDGDPLNICVGLQEHADGRVECVRVVSGLDEPDTALGEVDGAVLALFGEGDEKRRADIVASLSDVPVKRIDRALEKHRRAGRLVTASRGVYRRPGGAE